METVTVYLKSSRKSARMEGGREVNCRLVDDSNKQMVVNGTVY